MKICIKSEKRNKKMPNNKWKTNKNVLKLAAWEDGCAAACDKKTKNPKIPWKYKNENVANCCKGQATNSKTRVCCLLFGGASSEFCKTICKYQNN